MREKLARKIIEKKVLQRQKEIEDEKKKALEDGELVTDDENELPNVNFPIGIVPLPPQPPDLFFVPPPPPPEDDIKDDEPTSITVDKETTDIPINKPVPSTSNSTAHSVVLQYDTDNNKSSEEVLIVGAKTNDGSLIVKNTEGEPISDDETAVSETPATSNSIKNSKVDQASQNETEEDYIGEDPDIDLY